MLAEEGHADTGRRFGRSGPPTLTGPRWHRLAGFQSNGQLVGPACVPVRKRCQRTWGSTAKDMEVEFVGLKNDRLTLRDLGPSHGHVPHQHRQNEERVCTILSEAQEGGVSLSHRLIEFAKLPVLEGA